MGLFRSKKYEKMLEERHIPEMLEEYGSHLLKPLETTLRFFDSAPGKGSATEELTDSFAYALKSISDKRKEACLQSVINYASSVAGELMRSNSIFGGTEFSKSLDKNKVSQDFNKIVDWFKDIDSYPLILRDRVQDDMARKIDKRERFSEIENYVGQMKESLDILSEKYFGSELESALNHIMDLSKDSPLSPTFHAKLYAGLKEMDEKIREED